MTNLFKLLLTNLVVFVFLKASFAQEILSTDAIKKQFPGHHAAYSKYNYTVELKKVKGEVKMFHHVHVEEIALDQQGAMSLNEDYIETSSFEKLTINSAYVLVPTEKGSYTKSKATSIITRDAEAEGYIFHDDTKETVITYTSLEAGAIRVIDYSIEMTDLRMPWGYNFGTYIPMLEGKLETIRDTSIHIHYQKFNCETAQVNYSESTKKNVTTQTWTIQNSPAYREEEGSPSRKYYLPHILVQVSHYYMNGQRKNVLSSVDDLYAWYYGNIEEVVKETPSTELKHIADSLCVGKTDEFEKVRTIYYWVQNNIKYIAFEEGINGFVPRQPSSIIAKRYGDCKDMASLIYCMLKTQGIPSYLTWVGSRDLPYAYTQFASPTCDNHMITTYVHKDKEYFLDATNSFLSINDCASFTLGKEVIQAIGPKEFKISKIPISPDSFTVMVDTTYIELADKKLLGLSKSEFNGYYKQLLQPTLQATSAAKLNTTVQDLIGVKGNNSFHVSKASHSNLTNRDTSIIMQYVFEIDNYTTVYDKEIFVNMVLEKGISRGEIKKDRNTPMEFDYLSNDTYNVALSIPEGYKLKSVPKNINYNSEPVDFHINYSVEDDLVIMKLNFRIKKLMMQSHDFDAWNEYHKLARAAFAQSVVLIEDKK